MTFSAFQSRAFYRVGRIGTIPLPLVFILAFFAICVAHQSLLHLPYFWDEGGYYVPAALDFYHTRSLIPVFTNAHPPLPNIILGSLWHVFGCRIVVTRLTACAAAALGLTATFALGRVVLGAAAAAVLTALTAIYPIWFAQSTLAHADIFAAAFTLSGLSLYLSSRDGTAVAKVEGATIRTQTLCSVLFCLSVLAKETAVVQPVALATLEFCLAWRARSDLKRLRDHLAWAFALATSVPVLAAWYFYHFLKTGYMFGNPVYLRYNATANLTMQHVVYAFRIRLVHLFWQRGMWVPLALTAMFLLLLPPAPEADRTKLALPPRQITAILTLICANWAAFSVLGGALLTRYLLPIYPLLLLVSIAVWKQRTHLWVLPAILSAVAFTNALWKNPESFFAPEDNLTYRDMIVVQQQAIRFLGQNYPNATVLTAWPVSADLTKPELGYTQRPFHTFPIEGFSKADLDKAAAQPGSYDTALVFATHYTSPAFRKFLVHNPRSWRGRRYRADLDLFPNQIAAVLGGEIVWQNDINGEWAAVIRFHRTYNAQLLGSSLLKARH